MSRADPMGVPDAALDLSARRVPNFPALGNSRVPELPRTIIVGITGFKQHGKDTAARVLTERYGFKKVSFADGLKQAVALVLRVPVERFEDNDFKESVHEPSGLTYRQWLQQIGTEGFRARYANVWVDWTMAEIAAQGWRRVVFTDVRFPNEAQAIRRFDGETTLIRVTNPNKAPSGDLHESEVHIPNLEVDIDIWNNNTVVDLQQRIEAYALSRHKSIW